MLQILKKFWHLLNGKEKRVFCLLTFLMVVGAWMELLGLGMVLPLVAVLTDPTILERNRIIAWAYKILAPAGPKEFLLYLCGITVCIFLLKNLYLFFLTYLQTQFIQRNVSRLGEILFQNYIYAPVTFHAARGVNPLLTNFYILQQLAGVTILSFMTLLTEVINVLFILLFLVWVTPWVAFGFLGVLIISTSLLIVAVRWRIAALGRELYSLSIGVSKTVLESFRGIKLVKILGCEKFLQESFCRLKRKENQLSARVSLYGQAPRFLFEIVMVAGGVGVLVVFLLSGMTGEAILLNFSLIGAAMVRLMPSFTRIQYNYTNFRVQSENCHSIFADLQNTEKEELGDKNAPAVTLERSLCLQDVAFSYWDEAGHEKKVLDGFSLEIPARSSLAFIGTTGCGKTTTVDLIAGLIRPQKGRILADGKDIFDSLGSWRSLIGYVPQEILLSDDTLAGNIAFGVPEEDRDGKQLEKVLKMAQLEEFVKSLPNGVNTRVGENGVRLSGGQKQRIGIARALYREPSLLILDEATSALDNETEKEFMDSLRELHGKITLILIAHRLTTTRYCDKILDMSPKE